MFISLKVGKKLDKILKIQKNYKNIMLKKLFEFMLLVNFFNVDVNVNFYFEMKKQCCFFKWSFCNYLK